MPAQRPLGENLVDPAAVLVENFEAPSMRVEALADLRQMAGVRQNEAGGRLIAPVLGRGHCEQLQHFVGGHSAGNEP
ncbi:hypothetical protein C5689_14890 [Methylosinus sporium]|uniref:Uncharacterized protein n=1 Tax=Methylosinus sporium TaxID=428 RepID=A0A2U1SN60_METSR|nr:hypothetical protein C5689_14890 [Methylosinus sporium]